MLWILLMMIVRFVYEGRVVSGLVLSLNTFLISLCHVTSNWQVNWIVCKMFLGSVGVNSYPYQLLHDLHNPDLNQHNFCGHGVESELVKLFVEQTISKK